MQRRHVIAIGIGWVLIVGLLAAGVALYDDGSQNHDSGNVVLYDGDDRVATINATVADDAEERYTGLSDHQSLANDEGMLFVYGSERDSLAFVMRDMDFGIDIVYVDGEGCVTSVHAAPEPGPNEDGEEQRYPGSGQYVIEVPIGVASDAGVDAGDPVQIEYGNSTVDGTEASCFES